MAEEMSNGRSGDRDSLRGCCCSARHLWWISRPAALAALLASPVGYDWVNNDDNDNDGLALGSRELCNNSSVRH